MLLLFRLASGSQFKGAYHHVIVSTNGTDIIKTYFDGGLVETVNAPLVTPEIGIYDFIRIFGPYTYMHYADFDLLRIFNRMITDAEALELYNERI